MEILDPIDVTHRKYTYISSNIIKYGISYGAVAAMILSYSANKSILWMIINGWFSWFYVVYFALFKS